MNAGHKKLLPLLLRHRPLSAAAEDFERFEEWFAVKLHPLARTMPPPGLEEIENAMAAMEEELKSPGKSPGLLRPLIYVGDQLLDGRLRLTLHTELTHPATAIPVDPIDESEELVRYLEANVATLKHPARRAAVGLRAAWESSGDCGALKRLLFAGQTIGKRPSLVGRLSELCRVNKRTMSYALSCAANPNRTEEFSRVVRGEDRGFRRVKSRSCRRTSPRRSQTKVRHLIMPKSPREQQHPVTDVNLLLCPSDWGSQNPIGLLPDACKLALRVMKRATDDAMPMLAADAFVCLLLPPFVVADASFGDLLSLATELGFSTQGMACAVVQPSSQQLDITHSWQLAWILGRESDKKPFMPFTNALAAPARIDPSERCTYNFRRIVRSFCPRYGSVFAWTLELATVESLLPVIAEVQCKLILPDATYDRYIAIDKRARSRG